MFQLRVNKSVTAAQINGLFLKILSEQYGKVVTDTTKVSESVVILRGGIRYQRLVLEGHIFAFHLPDLTCVFHEGKRILCFETDSNQYLDRFLPFCAEDGGFQPSDDFYECDERVERMLKNIAEGKTRTMLPLVVVSAYDNWELPIDPGVFARLVVCRAHVVSINDVSAARRIETACSIRMGAVTVLGARPLLYTVDAFENEETMINEISKTLYTGRNLLYPGTWTEVLEEKMKAAVMIPLAEEKEDSDHEELVRIAEKESENWKEKYAQSERKCASLKAELDGLKKSMAVAGMGILERGKEEDYYPDEAKELIIKVLKKAIPNEAPRVRDVLTDIVENNPIDNNGEKLREEIRSIFRSDAGINERCKNNLIRAGFTISSDGKHHKVIWRGDQRYITTIAKTSSTHRAADDEALTILQQILGN